MLLISMLIQNMLDTIVARLRKKQIVLDEQDIKEFHEDAEHLRWLYNRMVREHGESVNFDYMHRFANIFNKLKQL